MRWIQSIAEEKINEAIKKGEFDNLPGHGKPLVWDDDAHVPESLRMSFKLMKNAGVLPEEMQLRKDWLRIEDLLACCHDPLERERLTEQLTEKKLKYTMLMEKRGWSGTSGFAQYQEKIEDKLLKDINDSSD